MCCILPPGYLTSGRQNRYLRQLRRTAPFAYVKTLTRTAGGRPVVAIQLGCGSHKVLLSGTHHANESITGTLLWELLLAYCRAICEDGCFGGKPARALYRNSMLYCVPLVNPDGADLVAGEIPNASPEYQSAAQLAASYPQLPFPSGWKANLRGVDLNLNYPANWDKAKQIKASLGFDRPAPRDYPGEKPLDQRETAALAAYTACVRPSASCLSHAGARHLPRRRGARSAGVRRDCRKAFRRVRLRGTERSARVEQRRLQGLVLSALSPPRLYHRDRKGQKSFASGRFPRCL